MGISGDRILFYNGRLFSLDQQNTTGSAMLIRGDKVEAVLDRYNHLVQDESMHKIDLKGRAVLPGFNDNHIHLNFWGDALSAPHFHGLDEVQIVARLKKHYGKVRAGEIIHGYNWDFPACENPTREFLDQAFPGNPVVLSQYGGHGHWVNSITLKKMGVWRRSGRSRDGIIERKDDGSPTGIIKGSYDNPFFIHWYMRRLFSYRENLVNYRRALGKCAELGITSVQDNTWSFVSVFAIRKLFKQKPLPRISCWSYGAIPLFSRLLRICCFSPPMYSRGLTKFFIDGSFSSRTAWLSRPYENSDNSGHGKSKEEIKVIAEKMIRKKRRFAFHAIGDRAIGTFLDALEELLPRYSQMLFQKSKIFEMIIRTSFLNY